MSGTLKRCECCDGLNLPLATKCEHCGGHRFEPEETVVNLYRSGDGQAMKDRFYIGSRLCLSGPLDADGERLWHRLCQVALDGADPMILSRV